MYKLNPKVLRMAKLVACKATQNVVDVQTKGGVVQYTVPSTKRQLDASPHKERWIASSWKGVEKILNPVRQGQQAAAAVQRCC